MRKQDRPLWISLLVVVGIAVIFFGTTLAANWSPKLGLDLDGGLSVVYQTHTPVTASELNTIVTILSDRVNAGTTGATVESQGKNQIAVSIPGEKNSQQVLATLGNTAQLYFREPLCYADAFSVKKGQKPTTGPLPTTCASTSLLNTTNLNVTPNSSAPGGFTSANPPPDPSLTTYPSTSPLNDNKGAYVLLPASGDNGLRYLLGPAQLTGSAVHSANAQLTSVGQWAVNLSLTGTGATQWDNFSKTQFHEPIGIDLDGQVISAPITLGGQSSWSSFGGQVQITGSFTEDQAKTLATQLNYGSLPVKLDRLNVQTVSPTLGKASLQAGLAAGLAGLLLVMAYIIFYYRALGLVVLAGLGITGALLWSIISFLGQASNTTIDLAGVIGIIVSIGITVDSYIVYFERLKDEARAGRTIRSSVDRGFQSAWRTVVAADAVSLLGAVVLYYLSVGEVQGFALFLGISTILDLIVTYFFTRPCVTLLGRRSDPTETRAMTVASGLGVSTRVPV